MVKTSPFCPECGAVWTDGKTCTDYFHLLGFWELDHQLYDVHHLMVICYHVQHPSLYSPEALQAAQQMLVEFVEGGVSPQMMRQRLNPAADSGQRAYRIKGTPESHGVHIYPITWSMTVADVTSGGIENYYASIRAWAKSVLRDLRESRC
ncbi:MAG: DUF5946 family protein [Anaerolineae bacterium]|nr:DUF5946 family protein [Anaerolineae bacterium]